MSESEDCLWEVIEQHFDEAYFGFWRFEAALASPIWTLAELPRFEERLEAQLDGLVVAGPSARERILLPSIEQPSLSEPVRVTVAALGLLQQQGGSASLDVLLPALRHRDARVRGAAVRAYQLSARTELDAWLQAQLEKTSDVPTLSALFELAAVRKLPPAARLTALESEDPGLRAAAARAAAFAEPTLYKNVLERMTEDADADVRRAALLVTVRWNRPAAFEKLTELAFAGKGDRTLLALFASLASRAGQTQLVQGVKDKTTRRACLYALGFSGNAELIPLLLSYLQSKDPLTAKLAAQSLALISGVDLHAPAHILAKQPRTGGNLPPPEQDPEARASLPPLEEDNLAADLVPAAEQHLPTPNAHALAAWFQREAARFAAPVRYVWGAPYGAASLSVALERAPLGLRHDLALALAARSAGQVVLDTRGYAHAQRAELAQVSKAQLSAFTTF